MLALACSIFRPNLEAPEAFHLRDLAEISRKDTGMILEENHLLIALYYVKALLKLNLSIVDLSSRVFGHFGGGVVKMWNTGVEDIYFDGCC